MNKLDEITEFALNHTDEQCGLEVANVSVWDNFGIIRVCVSAKRASCTKSNQKQPNMIGMRQEWLEQAEDFIEEIGRDPRAGNGGLGVDFELSSVSDRSFELIERKD